MIKAFFYFLLALVTGLLATLFLAKEPGYLLVSFGKVTFESSLFALFVALMALLILLRLLYLILDWINPLRLVGAGRRWQEARAEKKRRNAPLPEEALRSALEAELRQHSDAQEGGTLSAAQLRKLWKQRTKKVTTDDVLIAVYADALCAIGESADAIKAVEAGLAEQWSDALVRKYSLLGLKASDAQAAQQLKRAEAWLESRAEDGELLLAAGRLSLRVQLWGKAREYFERSLRAHPDAEVFAELARLLGNLREPERNARYLVGPTQQISKTLPEFPQPG